MAMCSLMCAAGAAETEGATTVSGIITTEVASLKAEVLVVIAASLVFFGAKLLWSKFKGMARYGAGHPRPAPF
ncbi:hypothetical protein [Butyricicoccus sp. Marseille-Q5471]|uniref:hypothetical protein n=1 Tax=Butyricicoccus sp. Marseille-Q5471 TaxID=3039493 RepID=UPI0024BBFAC0|nr:hypothetical protein [Butyricicoccus sp. Marseille-Q5471]